MMPADQVYTSGDRILTCPMHGLELVVEMRENAVPTQRMRYAGHGISVAEFGPAWSVYCPEHRSTIYEPATTPLETFKRAAEERFGARENTRLSQREER